jgi:hypothetical protein
MNSGPASWFALWHRRYRVALICLILATCGPRILVLSIPVDLSHDLHQAAGLG